MPEQAGPKATRVACSVCRLLAEHPPSAQPVPQLARPDTGRGSEPAGEVVLVAETGDVGDLTRREGGVVQVTCSAHLVLRSLGPAGPRGRPGGAGSRIPGRPRRPGHRAERP